MSRARYPAPACGSSMCPLRAHMRFVIIGRGDEAEGFKSHRHATNKIGGISDKPAAFLDAFSRAAMPEACGNSGRVVQ